MSSTPVPVSAPSDDRLGRLIDAVGQLAQQQRSLLESLRPPAQPAAAPSAAPPHAFPPQAVASQPTLAPSGAAPDLRSMVADLFRQQVASARQSAIRDSYVGQHLADLPEAYRRLMPETADTSALADAEQTIRRQFRDDLKSVRRSVGEAGGNLGGDELVGRPPGAAVDYARLSPMQQIALGLKSAQPSAGGASGVAPAAKPSDRASPDAGDHARAPSDMLDGEPLFVGAD